jgi:hypothetical protein
MQIHLYQDERSADQLDIVPEGHVKLQPLCDRFQDLRYELTRNRAAAAIAFVSGILFISSGYKAKVEIYNSATNQMIAMNGLTDFWQYLIVSLGVFALLAQREEIPFCSEPDFSPQIELILENSS